MAASRGHGPLNNQYRLKASTDPVLAWFELRRKLWGARAETESAQAAHKSLDELIRPTQTPIHSKQIPP